MYQLLESVEVSKFQVSADQASGNLQQKLSSALSQAGIDTSQEIDLQLDSSGNVVVSNNNSQAQQIENTINNNPNLKKAVTDYLEFMQAIAPTSRTAAVPRPAPVRSLDNCFLRPAAARRARSLWPSRETISPHRPWTATTTRSFSRRPALNPLDSGCLPVQSSFSYNGGSLNTSFEWFRVLFCPRGTAIGGVGSIR